MPIQSNVISNYVEGNSCSIFGAWFFSLWSSFSMNFYIKKQSPTAFICFSWWLGLCLYIWSIGRAYKKVSRVRCIMQESQFLSIHKESYLHLRHKETILKVRIHSRPILSYAHRWGCSTTLVRIKEFLWLMTIMTARFGEILDVGSTSLFFIFFSFSRGKREQKSDGIKHWRDVIPSS